MAIDQAEQSNTATGADSGADDLSLREQIEAAFEKEPTDELRNDARDEGDASRARDDLGRFAKQDGKQEVKPEAKPAPVKAETVPADPNAAPQTQQPGQQTQPGQQGQPSNAPPAPDLKAPVSWKPDIREKWGTLPPEVKSEIHRREGEFQRFMQDTAADRQFVDAFERTARPFEMFIRAENSSPLQAFENLMQTAALLRVGTSAQKVGVVADICTRYGIDLGLLDSTLAQMANMPQQIPGAPHPGQSLGQQQFRDPRLDQMIAYQQQHAQQQEQTERAELQTMVGNFAQTHEFFYDVNQTMADLIEMAGRRGEILTAENAYTQACKLNENVAKILTTREAASSQATNAQAVLRAKRAASSVKNEATPETGATVPKDDSVRAALEAAFETTARR